MQAYTAAQRSLLDARDDQVKMCIEIDDTTPLRYCTGDDPVQVDSDWYDPRGMTFSRFDMTTPMSAKTSVTINDHDGDIRTQWYTSKLDADAKVVWLLRDIDGSWTAVLTIEWHVDSCSFDDKGRFTVTLSAASGTRPRAGGAIGTRSEFPYAPEPGEAMRLGSSGIVFRPGIGTPPPPPGGQQRIRYPHSATNIQNPVTMPIDDTPSDPPSQIPGGGGTSANS